MELLTRVGKHTAGYFGKRNRARATLKHRFNPIMRIVVAVSLAVSFTLFPVSGSASHSPFALVEIAAQHAEAASRHGHSHDEAEEKVAHAFHGHAHNSADHDHNSSFLMPVSDRAVMSPNTSHCQADVPTALLGLAPDLDKPPRT